MLPGVTGEAATAARFAGQWAERTRSAATPTQGQRIYEVDDVVAPAPVDGQLRQATSGDRDLLVAWFEDFQLEIGEAPSPAAPTVDRRLASGDLWFWDDGTPVAMLGISDALVGVERVGPVFTLTDRRGKGYASALVAATSSAARARGNRCILYTDLSNPTSNAIYRAIGYQAVAEGLRYEFTTDGPSRR